MNEGEVLRVSAEGTIADAERLLGEIGASSTTVGALVIPQQVKRDRLGGTAAAMQAIATWARKSESRILRTYISSTENGREGMIKDLAATHHGLMAILMADQVQARDGIDITHAARQEALRALAGQDRMVSRSTVKESLFIAADHTSFDRPSAFYRTTNMESPEGMLKMEPELRPLVGGMLMRLGQSSGVYRKYLIENVEAISGVLFELFENTHKHARKDADGSAVLNRSVRAVRVEWVTGKLSDLTMRSEGNEALCSYVTNKRHGRTNWNQPNSLKDFQRFIEFSVVDTGPGIAAPLLHLNSLTNPTFEQEFEAVQRALQKNTSSLPSSSRGIGLHRVQELLTKLEGFIRLRSGRVDISRDFVTNPYDTSLEEESSWILSGEKSPKPTAAGTQVTILIPIDVKSE